MEGKIEGRGEGKGGEGREGGEGEEEGGEGGFYYISINDKAINHAYTHIS